jgi:hypothetical protein
MPCQRRTERDARGCSKPYAIVVAGKKIMGFKDLAAAAAG